MITALLPHTKTSVNLIHNKNIRETGNLTPLRLCVTPGTVSRQNVTTNAEIKQPLTDLPHSAQIKTFITLSIQGSQSGTTTTIPRVRVIPTNPPPSTTPVTMGKVLPQAQRTNIQTNAKVLSNTPSNNCTVFSASPVTLINQTASPAATQVTVKVQVAPPSLATTIFFANPIHSTVVCVSPPKSSTTPLIESNAIRTFTVIDKSVSDSHKLQTILPSFSPRTSSLIKWVVEEGGPLPPSPSSPPSLISSTVASKVFQVVAKREQSTQNCEVTSAQAMVGETKMMGKKTKQAVVMYNNKVFFRVKNNSGINESQEHRGQSEVINLCDELLDSKEGANACPDEDNVEFVAYITGQTNSCHGGGMTEKTSQIRNSPDIDEGVQHNSAKLVFSHRMNEKRKRHSIENSTGISAAPCPMSERKLKRTFGITSDLRINLRRIQVNSSDTGRSCFMQVSPLDYTEPIDEDFLCSVDPLHSQICSTTSYSRVSRTRKRTKCSCCFPAALHRHRVRNRRSKPGGGGRRDTTRKLLKLQSTSIVAMENSSFGREMDSEELQIHQQIQILRETLRLKEAALQKLKNDKNC